MLAIATAVAAAIPTIPIMLKGNRVRAWRSDPRAFAAGRPAGGTRPLDFAGGLVEVGGGAVLMAAGLAADSTGMSVAAGGLGWAAAGAVVRVAGLLVCSAAG